MISGSVIQLFFSACKSLAVILLGLSVCTSVRINNHKRVKAQYSKAILVNCKSLAGKTAHPASLLAVLFFFYFNFFLTRALTGPETTCLMAHRIHLSL